MTDFIVEPLMVQAKRNFIDAEFNIDLIHNGFARHAAEEADLVFDIFA
jgi:hypothetical protein